MSASPVSTSKAGNLPGPERLRFGRYLPNRNLVRSQSGFPGEDVQQVQPTTQGLAVGGEGGNLGRAPEQRLADGLDRDRAQESA